MLIKAYEIAPGDEIITRKQQDYSKVKCAYLLEDGYIDIAYENGEHEWFNSSQIVFRKDDNPHFFTGTVKHQVE